MKKGFTFSFIDRKESKRFHYLAKYDTDLSIDINYETIKPDRAIPHIEKRGKADDPWTIFYKYATFDSILRGLSLYAVRVRQDTRNEPNDDYMYTWKVIGEMDSGVPVLSIDYAAFLKGIAENPDRLRYNSDALDRFIMILWAAKTGIIPPHMKENNIDREEIKKMLIKNLVPKHRGGKTILPQGTEAARKLLKLLASHISERCKNIIKKYEVYDDQDALIWNSNYKCLKEHCDIKLYRESQEPRVSGLSKNEMKNLIQRPADYADAILENMLSVSLSTLNHFAK